MIAFINGKLIESLPNSAIIDVNGIGYEIMIPITSYDKLPEEGNMVKLLTHLHVTENSQSLYGFISEEDRSLFKILVKVVSGIGPKLAIGILSGISSNDFKSAVANGDTEALINIKGVGKKSAQRIILELQDKIDATDVWKNVGGEQAKVNDQEYEKDAFMALIALGYNKKETQNAINTAKANYKNNDEIEISTSELIKLALRELS